MTRSKRRRNRATLEVDLNELDAIITALVNDTRGDLDPGLLGYLDVKRTNLRQRIAAAPDSDEQTREHMRRWAAADESHANEEDTS